jgi:Flp pilus assembly protein TadD
LPLIAPEAMMEGAPHLLACRQVEMETLRITPANASERKRLVLILGMLLVLGTCLLYAPTMGNGFVNFDDPDYVTRNPAVQHGLSWHNVVWAFGTDNPAANWHPLTWLSHMLDVQMYGANPRGHHFTNVLLFAFDVLLLFVFLERATGAVWRSAAVAALFAAHPLNVETVAWVAERKSVLSILFMLLTLLAYAGYVRMPNTGRMLGVCCLFTLALLSKIMVVALPCGMLLLDFWPLQRFPHPDQHESWKSFIAGVRPFLIEKIPLFLLSTAAAGLTFYIQHRNHAVGSVMPLSWRIKNALFSYVLYLGKIVWPSRLAVFYPHPENSLHWFPVIVATLLLLGITVAAFRASRKPYLLFGWLWYLGMLFPMIGLVQSGRQGMADRYACLSLIGVLIAVVWFASDWAPRVPINPRFLGGVTCAALLTSCAYVTHTQIGFWRDSQTLFGHALQVTRNNGMAESNFGAALLEAGNIDGALPHLETAVRLIPDLAVAHYDDGLALQRQGRLTEAAQQYRLAIRFSVDRFEGAQAHNNLGVIYMQSGNSGLAESEFTSALDLNPDEVNSRLARGVLEHQGGQFDAALADFTRAAQTAPSPIAFFWIGRALESKGDAVKAESAYQHALQFAPNLAEARARLAALQGNAEKVTVK